MWSSERKQSLCRPRKEWRGSIIYGNSKADRRHTKYRLRNQERPRLRAASYSLKLQAVATTVQDTPTLARKTCHSSWYSRNNSKAHSMVTLRSQQSTFNLEPHLQTCSTPQVRFTSEWSTLLLISPWRTQDLQQLNTNCASKCVDQSMSIALFHLWTMHYDGWSLGTHNIRAIFFHRRYTTRLPLENTIGKTEVSLIKSIYSKVTSGSNPFPYLRRHR